MAAAIKLPQKGESPPPQPMADRQPSESFKLLERGLRILSEDEKQERENENPFFSRGLTKVAANKLPKRCEI